MISQKDMLIAADAAFRGKYHICVRDLGYVPGGQEGVTQIIASCNGEPFFVETQFENNLATETDIEGFKQRILLPLAAAAEQKPPFDLTKHTGAVLPRRLVGDHEMCLGDAWARIHRIDGAECLWREG